jgi:LacI family transcriptional regulator
MNKYSRELTIYDIADLLKISPSTVSRALNNHPSVSNKTKKKVIETANELGYRFNKFARNLRQQKSYILGVVIPRLDSYFMSSVIAGMESYLYDLGYNLMIVQSDEKLEKELKCLEMLYNSRVDGIMISFSSETKNLNHIKEIFNKKIPLVIFDRYINQSGITCVVIDNKKAAKEIVEHLISIGRKNILHLSGNLNCSVYNDRFNGYKDALIEAGIEYRDDFVMKNVLYEKSSEDIYSYILSLKKFPDAIFAAHDILAVQTISYLKQKGVKIPDDIAIAGFNDDPIATVVEPNLTTIKYPGNLIGQISAKTLLEIINGNTVKIIDKIVLQHELCIRDSTKI